MDFNILYFLNDLHTPLLDKLMVFITELGSGGLIWIVITIIMLLNKKTRKIGICSAISLVLSLLFCNILLKNIIARPRPCWIDESIKLLVAVPDDYSFPSGHTSSSFSSAVSIFLYNKKSSVPFLMLACLISFSRLYLFVHFPTDVLAGLILGITLAFTARYVTEELLKKSCKN